MRHAIHRIRNSIGMHYVDTLNLYMIVVKDDRTCSVFFSDDPCKEHHVSRSHTAILLRATRYYLRG